MNITFFKNPNWLEASQLATYKRGRGTELDTVNVSLCILFVLANFNLLLRADDTQKGRNSSPQLQLYFIEFRSCWCVSQSQLFSRSISLACEKFWFIFRLIRSLMDPTYPLLITFTLYSHFIVRLRVLLNSYFHHRHSVALLTLLP